MGTVTYREYLRGKFNDFDIITYHAQGQCLPVDYVNFRGHAASTITALFWHVRDGYALHIASNHTSCAFGPYAGDVPSEDNFGFDQVESGKSSCTLHNDGTTQWWFGGYMAD